MHGGPKLSKAIGWALSLTLLLAPRAAAAQGWDAKISSRLTLGGGAYVAEQTPSPWPLFELGLRSDVLFGEARPARVRFGPALDFRSEDFRTFEVAGGLAVLLPVDRGFAFTLTGGGGWGARPQGRDGPLALGVIAFGWRPYDYFSAYAWGIDGYVSTRVQLNEPRVWEITVGVEVDCGILFAIPFMFLYELAHGHDPDEPAR